MPRVRVEGVAEEPPIAATNAASPDAIEDEVAQQEQVRSQHR
jgi:hypothetical protein